KAFTGHQWRCTSTTASRGRMHNRRMGIPVQEMSSRNDQGEKALRTEFCLKCPHVAVERLTVRVRKLALHCGFNAGVTRCSQTVEYGPLALSPNTHRWMVFLLREPIHCGQYLLHLVTENVPAHLVGLTVDELPVRLIRPLVQSGVTRKVVLSVDQHR